MIKDNGDGTYDVTFPGRKPVKVTQPSEAEIAFYGGAGKNGLWLAVMEKGWGQIRSQKNWVYNEQIPQDELDSGETAASGISALTTNKVVTDKLTKAKIEATRDKLDAAFTNKKMVTAAIAGGDEKKDDEKTFLPTKHAYSVIGWDRATDTITLRNPWGRREIRDANGNAADGKDDGVFTMKLADFYKHFHEIAYEQ